MLHRGKVDMKGVEYKNYGYLIVTYSLFPAPVFIQVKGFILNDQSMDKRNRKNLGNTRGSAMARFLI